MSKTCELNGKPCIYPDKNCNVYCEVYIHTPAYVRAEVEKRLEKGDRRYGRDVR